MEREGGGVQEGLPSLLAAQSVFVLFLFNHMLVGGECSGSRAEAEASR